MRSRYMPRTVGAKFLTISISLAFGLAIALFVVFEFHTYRQAHHTLVKQLNQTVEGYRSVLVEPVWNLDNNRIDLILSAMASDSTLQGAAVYDDGGAMLSSVGVPGTPGDALTAKGEIVYAMKPMNAAQPIGYLLVTFTDAQLRDETQRRLVLDGVLVMCLFTAVVVSSVIAHRRTVGIPLARLLSAIHAARQGKPYERVEWKRTDEVGMVIAAYNEMQDHRRQIEDGLRQARDQLEHRVAERMEELQQVNEHLQQEIIERRLAEQAKVTQVARLQTLVRLTPLLSSSLDLDAVLREIAQAAATLMDVPMVSFCIADEQARTLQVSAFSDEAIGADFSKRQFLYGESGVGWVAANRQTLNVDNVFDD
jgi:methyl-accepting chemotaxis protein